MKKTARNTISCMALILGVSSTSITGANAIWNPFAKCFGGGDIQAEEIMSNANQGLGQVIELTNQTIETIDQVNNLVNSVATNLESAGIIQESTLKVIKDFSQKVKDGTKIAGSSIYEVEGYKRLVGDDLAQLNEIIADGKITKDEAIVLSEYLPELLEFVDKWNKTGDTKAQIEKIKAALKMAQEISDAVQNSSSAVASTDDNSESILLQSS